MGDLTSLNKVYIYDSTLRDGAQAEGISFTVTDKLKITKRLDDFGIDYIEAGNPGSNIKDMEFFQCVKKLDLKHAKLVAFGSTRKADIKVSEDNNVLSLLSAETGAVAIFGKSSLLHVTDVLRTSPEENINMIFDTIHFFKENGKEVIFDAEHFFDGYKLDADYAMKTLQSAVKAGVDCIALCDTNGGSLPYEIEDIVKAVIQNIHVQIGIHCHNDAGMAAANSIIAVQNGVSHIQGTINGYGERCGNANLCTIIPSIELKLNIKCIADKKIQDITNVSRYVSEIANLAHNEREPYVGNSAFAHKGGMHIDAVQKNSKTFEHISPETVGNSRRILMSEVSGRSTIINRVQEVAPWITRESPETQQIIDKLKELEYLGYQFEGAESSFKLMVIRELGKDRTFFNVKDFRVLCENPWNRENSAFAIIKVEVDGEEEVTAAEGDGPINALDKALRKALEIFYPELSKIRLTDYKVRVLESGNATASRVRVHIESTDGDNVWGTVGVSTNIVEASWEALVDSIEYFLYENGQWIINN
ncbi:MAG: citramalate synthase [Bacillota bacterium]|nr:citramalate synthase [Bacillota bacterium]